MSDQRSRAIRVRGRAKIGLINPYCDDCNLIITNERLILATDYCTYRFTSNEIVLFKVKQDKIHLVHTVKKYPSKIRLIFKDTRTSLEIIVKIEQAGFIATGDRTKHQVYKMPALIIAVLLWTVPQVYMWHLNTNESLHVPTLAEIIYCLTLFIFSLSVLSSSTLQKMIIKPNHSIEEITFDLGVIAVSYSGWFSYLTIKRIMDESLSQSSTLTIMVGSSGFIIGLLITLITVARSKESK